MGIFDEIKEDSVSEDDKNRLFETQRREGTSARNYLKFLVPIVLLVITGIGAVFYFTLPSVGDKIRPPQDLYDAVYDHMVSEKKRTVSDMDFYYCDTFYTADITVEPKPVAPTTPEDLALRFTATARKSEDGTWQVTTNAIQSKEQFALCQQ